MNLSLPFGPVPTEATIDSYRRDHSVRALRRVYSVEAAFGWAKRCFHRYETGGEPGLSWFVCSCQLAPRWDEPSGSENIGKNASQRCPTGSQHIVATTPSGSDRYEATMTGGALRDPRLLAITPVGVKTAKRHEACWVSWNKNCAIKNWSNTKFLTAQR